MNGFPDNLFSGARFAVLGLGRNGWPAAQALAAMGADIVVWDDDEAARTHAITPRLTVADLLTVPLSFDAVILSPGIPHLLPKPHPVAARARAAGIPILCDAELLFQAVRRAGSKARFVGITGTNGKSTTTALVAHILSRPSWPGDVPGLDPGIAPPSTQPSNPPRETAAPPVAAGANLGPAALALPLLPDDGVYVLEMSSYMLERLATLHFDAAAMLNLTSDHLDRHGDMPGYAAAKRAIFDRQTDADLAVVGIDDKPSREMAAWLSTHPASVVSISGPAAMYLTAKAPALPGAHNAQNAAAAAAIAAFLGVPEPTINRGIESFPGLPHRQQRVVTIDGITFINDSKATNSDAAARALGCYDRLIWVAGGLAKAGGIASLAPYFPRIAHAFLIGRDAPMLAATLREAGIPHTITGTLEAAVPAAFDAAKAASIPVVLLSPACASFDQFSGFDARGDRFAALVHALTHTSPPPLAGRGQGEVSNRTANPIAHEAAA
jgi:UDP-N-acetylmuramoylalanine--D-glutamate ligase